MQVEAHLGHMAYLATLPARVLSHPGFGSGRLIPRSGAVARVDAARGSRAARSLGSGPIVPGAQSGDTHGPDGPDGGVPRLATPRPPSDPGKGGRTSLPPEPGLLRERFLLLGPLLVLLKS